MDTGIDIDTRAATIAVDGITYDVESASDPTRMREELTLSLDGEEVFPGLRGELYSEEYIEEWMNPRADTDCVLGAMAVDYRGYSLGGGQDDMEPPDDFTIECPRCEGSGDDPERSYLRRGYFNRIASGSEESMQSELAIMQEREPDCTFYVEPDTCSACGGEGERQVHPVEWAKRVHGATVVLPLYVYEHSGITMSAGTFGGGRPGYPFTCPWDTSMVGLVFDTAETRERTGCTPENGWTPERIEENIRAEIEAYARYLEGDVTGYSVEDEETGYEDGCGGYVGESSYTEQECYRALGNAVRRRLREEQERADMAARDIVTVSA